MVRRVRRQIRLLQINMKVEANGTASIEFLDATGKVTERLPK